MSAVFRHQSIAGNTVGASRATEAGLHLVAFSLVTINAYHLSNFLVSKLTTHDSSALFVGLLYLVGIGIACLEIPLGKSLITAYRLDKFSVSTLIQSLLALVIISMAVVAGINSQEADADKRATQVTAYSQTDSNFENMRLSAKLERDSAILRADLIRDQRSRAIAAVEANRNYQASLVSINAQQATNTSHKPIETFESGSTMQTITMGLFSVVCSLGAMFVSAFSATFINPLVALPAFSLMAKRNHEWDSDGSDFKALKHELSPMGKVSGMLNMEKIPAKIAGLTSSSKGTAEKRPEPTPTMPNTELNNLDDASVRTLKEAYSQVHYERIKEGIISGVIKPTVRPVKTELERLNVKFLNDAKRQEKAIEILDQLKAEGVLIDNPEFGKSKKIVAKLLLNPNQKGGVMIRSSCPECSNTSSVNESLLKEWGGQVSCPNCKVVYVVNDNLA